MNPMESHVKIIAVLHIVLGALGLLGALALLLIFGGIATGVMFSQQGGGAVLGIPILGGIGLFLFLLVLLLSLPGLIGGIALLRFAPWSRIFMIVLSAIHLLNIPFGTALGIYGIWALTKPETERLFAQPPYQPVAY
jgi:hypothetical protein